MILNSGRIIFFLFTSTLIYQTCYASSIDNKYEISVNKSLPVILEDIEFAITERNMRIVDRLHLGQAVRERGNRNFPDNEIILYCSITFAEKMLELAPELINACPGRITVRGTDNGYIISAPLWPVSNKNYELKLLISNMNKMVKEIVDYASLEWFE